MKSKKALYLVAGIVFLGGLAFAFGNNDSFKGSLSGVLAGQQKSANQLIGSTTIGTTRNVMNLLQDKDLVKKLNDKLDDDRYTGVTDMTREDAEAELDLLEGYIESFEENQSKMEAQVLLDSPDLALIDEALTANEALFEPMAVQYRFLGDYRDYQSELTASSALMYQAFANIIEENEAEYEELLEEQESLQDEVLESLVLRAEIISDVAYLHSAEVGADTWDPYRQFALNDFGMLTIPELYDREHGHSGPFNFPNFYEGFRENLWQERSDVVDCVNQYYGSLDAPFSSSSMIPVSNCLRGFYLNALYMDYPWEYDSSSPTPEFEDEIAVLQGQVLTANNFSQLDSVLNDYLSLYSDAAVLLSAYDQLFVDYLNDASDEIARIDASTRLAFNRLSEISDRLSVLQDRATAVSSGGEETLEALLETSAEAQENFEWIADVLSGIDVSAFIAMNSLYQDEYNRLSALEQESEEEFVYEENPEEDEDELEEETAEAEFLDKNYIEEFVMSVLVEDYAYSKEDAKDVAKDFAQTGADIWTQKDLDSELESWLVEQGLIVKEEAEDDPEEEKEEVKEEDVEEFDYDSLAREIVEAYGVEYSELEEKFEKLLEEASDSQMKEDEFRKEVERMTEEFIASTAVDAYLLSLDQIRYLEDQDVFMINYSAVWLGAGISKSEEVVMNVEWNDEESFEFTFVVAISGSGQLYELKNMRDQLPYEKEALNTYVFSLSGSSLTYEIDNTPEVELTREEELSVLLKENFKLDEYIAEYEDAIYEFMLSSVEEGLTDDEFLKEAMDFFESLEAGEVDKDEAPADPFSKDEGDDDELVETVVEDLKESNDDSSDDSNEVAELQEELEEALAAAEAAAQSAANAASAAQTAANNAAQNSNDSQQEVVNVVIEYTEPETVETAVEETLVETVATETSTAVQDPNSPFSDVSEGTWYGDAIVALYDEGIMQGNEDGQAEPWKNGNRAELIVMIVRAFYSESELAQMNFEHQFDDVPETAWYNMHVSAAVEFNILDEKSKFYPSRNMTRAEFITAFIRAANRACVRCDADFIDVSQKDWYYRSLATAVSADLISGFEDGTFRPDDEINRAQVAAILEKALEIGWVR